MPAFRHRAAKRRLGANSGLVVKDWLLAHLDDLLFLGHYRTRTGFPPTARRLPAIADFDGRDSRHRPG
jgi:hypothetical protein